MKVWFGCTTAQWRNYKKYYFNIRDYLKKLGCVILFDWLDDADKFYQTDYKIRNINRIYRKVVRAIDAANAIVIEYTVPNFSSSHQINYSLFRRKPTLVMRLHKDNPRFADSYIEAIDSDYLTIKEYNLHSYKKIISEFIGMSKIGKGQRRYNVVLGRKQKYYLDWASSIYGQSRSKIVRNAIDKTIDKDDEYKKYIVGDF